MKEIPFTWETFIWEYLMHIAVALPTAMLIRFALNVALDRLYSFTPFGQLAVFSVFCAGIAGYYVTRFRLEGAAVFIWIPPSLLLTYEMFSLSASWDSSWTHVSKLQHVSSSLFGPNCTSQECLYTLPTDIFLASVAYSVGAYLRLPNGSAREAGIKVDR